MFIELRGREKQRCEKHRSVASPMHPNRIEATIFWCIGWHSNQQSNLAGANGFYFIIYIYKRLVTDRTYVRPSRQYIWRALAI